MKLTAHVAAKQFAGSRARGKTRQPRMSWNPVGFRWRHSTRPVAPRFARSPSPAVSNTWFPQFHLHFDAAEKVNDRPQQVPSQPPYTTTIVWRQLRERLLPRRPLKPGERHIAGQEQPLRRAGQGLALRHRNSREMQTVTSAKSAQITSRRAEQTFRRIIGTPSQRIVVPGSAGVRNAVDAVTPPMRPRISAVPLQLRAAGRSGHRARRVELSEAAGLRASGRPLVPMMERAPELAWRARTKTTMSAVAETSAEGVTGSSMAATQVASVRATLPIAASQIRENANARAMPLDPALVDRLAEDVIRRVERQIRIERERRGL